MSLQIFLQGRVLGIAEFLMAPASADASENFVFAGRSRFLALLCEVLPRALLNELGLARILLGSSGGGQFLVVLPWEAKPQAEECLVGAARQLSQLSGGTLRLVWAVTENLGDWSVVRRRLHEEMRNRRGAQAADLGAEAFRPFPLETEASRTGALDQLAVELLAADSAGWSPDSPGCVLVGRGKYVWPLSSSPSADAIPMARHAALDKDGHAPASLAKLAARAQGRKTWGVLRGDVDSYGVRLRRVQSVEEHIQLSVMYKQFFAGELEIVCSLPDFWQKVTILYTGGDDFAVCGAWDALIPLAREIQRLFHRFCEENLKDFPGPDGKTITMALALAEHRDDSLRSVFEDAGARLERAKSTDKDCISVLGRILEWRQLAAAAELRDTMQRVASEIGSPRLFLQEMSAFYRKDTAASGPSASPDVFPQRPWKIYGRLNRALGDTRDIVPQKLRTHLTNEMVAKGATQVKLRPAGRVALEWTRLLSEG
jgi:CRISPR-associated protein Csm1